MDITIHPGKLEGVVRAIPSKSQAHRLLICAAFAKGETRLSCPETNEDIEATASCLNALGATVTRHSWGYHVIPAENIPKEATLPVNESGSTLRFLLPVAGALGVNAAFVMKGRLPERPLSPLWEELERMGCSLFRPTEDSVCITGKLHPGEYSIDGGVSSQFVSGLLFAAALMKGKSSLRLTGRVESRPYIDMTQKALALFEKDGALVSPGEVAVEGDWSNGAFFLAAKALGSNLVVENLDKTSPQGDRAAAQWIPALKTRQTVCAKDIPDLVPILSVVAAANEGAVFTDIRRLRAKESDRVESVKAMLSAFGIQSESDENTLTVYPGSFTGGTVNSQNDHRIAMSAAIAATVASGDVTILGAQCVKKSYPSFWEEYGKLGGKYELNLR
ncbi:MAG: 3-phosphoshikimate 1-carboxyvinyltransferase [Faecousia sp.]